MSALVSNAVGLLLAPFARWNPVWGLVSISVIVGVALVWVYGRVSNQGALKRVKRSIAAGVYESVLFRHDVGLSLRAQVEMFIGGMKYFCVAIPPLLVLAIPSVLLLAHLNLHYGYRGLKGGESAIVSLDVSNDEALFDVDVTPSQGLSVTRPLRDLDAQSVSWRIDVAKDSSAREGLLALRIGETAGKLPIVVDSEATMVPSQSYASPWWSLLYPSEGFPGSLRPHVRRVSVSYPEREMSLAGVQMHWLIIFVVVSIAAGLAGSKIFGIEV